MTTHARYAGLSSARGPLTPEAVARLEVFFADPCELTWSDVYSIVVVGMPFTTFWQAVCAIDPTYPKRRPSSGSWSRIPDFFTARRALEHARQLAKERKAR